MDLELGHHVDHVIKASNDTLTIQPSRPRITAVCGSAPAMLCCPQLAFVVKMGDVEAPNPFTVEAKRKAKWPLRRGQATKRKRGPDWPPREMLYECDPNILKSTGTCKPDGELAILKSAAPGHLEVEPGTSRRSHLGRVW
jgi:hypothetical protein